MSDDIVVTRDVLSDRHPGYYRDVICQIADLSVKSEAKRAVFGDCHIGCQIYLGGARVSKWDEQEKDLFLECLIDGPLYEALVARLAGRSRDYARLYLMRNADTFEITGRMRGTDNLEWRVKEGVCRQNSKRA